MFSFRFRRMPEDVVDRAVLSRLLLDNGIDSNRNHRQSLLWDERYYCFNLMDWGRVFKDILWTLPGYSKKFDCDSFARDRSTRTWWNVSGGPWWHMVAYPGKWGVGRFLPPGVVVRWCPPEFCTVITYYTILHLREALHGRRA